MSSLFWQYFSKTLNWPLLKSRYLQVIVKGLALYMDRIRHDIAYARNQYFAELSPERLEDYAESRGIKRLYFDTDEQFQTRVINAYRWQKLAATMKGVPQILKESGYPNASVKNCRDDDPDRWAEFEVSFDGYKQDISQLVPLINEYKPARSKLGLIKTPAKTAGRYTVVGHTGISENIFSYAQSPLVKVRILGITRIFDTIIAIGE